MAEFISSYVEDRIQLANNLARGKCGGSISDAILILSSATSAIAAKIWPGEKIDKKRFVELLVRYSDVTPAPSMISLPLLYRQLKDPKSKLIIQSIVDKNGKSRILTDSDVDKTEKEVKSILPNIGSKIIRQSSYASLFYSEYRNSMVHEGEVSINSHSLPATRRNASISYYNYNYSRLIVIHTSWIALTLESVGKKLDLIYDDDPLTKPKQWWLDGDN